MKHRADMETATESGLKSPSGAVISRDGDDTEDDEDEDRTAAATVADLCSASHEFEWLSPGSQGLSYTNERRFSEHQHGDDQGMTSCQVSPARSVSNRPPKTPTHAWSRRSDVMDHMHNPYTECRRHLSPMRSSWCCPSPPPHAVCMYHSGIDFMPCGYDCYLPNCSCHVRHDPWSSPHHEIIRRESSSPLQRPCRRSRKRDCSPSAMSPRYSPVPNERHSGQDQWQIPAPDDLSSLQKIQELESDKKNLILQAGVLADQVDAQAHKIEELERQLVRKKDELIHLEQNIHQEVIARSTVENSKLELMTELSNLRLRLTAAERDRKESDDKCRKLEHEFVTLRTCIINHETELAILKGKLSRNGTHVFPGSESSEIEKLKSALDSVIVSNDEKDQKIEGLKSSLTKYKKLQDIVHHNKKAIDTSSGEYSICDVDSVLSSLNNDVFKGSSIEANVSPIVSSNLQSSVDRHINLSTPSHFTSNLVKGPSSPSTAAAFHKSNSVENMCPSSNVVIVPNCQYGTMPRHTGSQVLQQLQVRLREHEVDADLIPKSSSLEKCESARKEDSLKVSTKNSKSSGGSGTKNTVVSFAAQECVTIPPTEKENDEYIAPLTPQPYLIKADKDKNRGFLKFFSKWKKTGSQNIDRVDDFKRGGARATAGPRLGWSRDLLQEPDLPFVRWNTDMIVEWLHRLGLSMYVNECKRWMCNGDMLAKASTNELEKELGIKNPLHKKKFSLAIKSMTTGLPNVSSSINNLDYHWVVRWLDDVGLPQYKDSFSEARVDGRVLHCLTIDDLLYLKVTSQLHHISIRRGIQLLRERGFDPHCLIRRSLPDESKTYTPDLVTLWSNHRVMEWLRTVDLSEYAPNLRGSGVHGALIVYELKFNTNLFATLLNIPPTKTLLRRHLATHFKHIVGDELTQLKREKETETPLSPSIKVKVIRKSQFALKKKRNKSEYENEDYVCPIETPVMNDSLKSSEGEKLVVRRNSDPSPQDPRHLELQTILQDENLNEAPTTVV